MWEKERIRESKRMTEKWERERKLESGGKFYVD